MQAVAAWQEHAVSIRDDILHGLFCRILKCEFWPMRLHHVESIAEKLSLLVSLLSFGHLSDHHKACLFNSTEHCKHMASCVGTS